MDDLEIELGEIEDELELNLQNEITIDLDDEDQLEGDLLISKKEEGVQLEKKISPPAMTIYEKINIITERVKQLDNGFKTTMESEVERMGLSKSYDIATLEFNSGKLPPYYVKRNHPNGSYEMWKHEDFLFFPE